MENISVPYFRLDDIKAKFLKIENRIKKLGIGSLSYTFSDPYPVDTGKKDRLGNPIYRQYIDVYLDATPPYIRGWNFVATLEHIPEQGNILRKTKWHIDTQLPSWTRTAKPGNCDHCKKYRRRKDTYILYNAESDIWQQIGRNCLADFIGGLDALDYVKYCQYIREIYSFADYTDDENGFDGEIDYYNNAYRYDYSTLSILTVARHIIKNIGYLPKSKCVDDSDLPTSQLVREYLGYTLVYTDWLKPRLKHELSEQDAEHCQDALQWAASLPDEKTAVNDYLHNIKILAADKAISSRNIGYLVSILPMYEKHLQTQKEQELGQASAYVGEVKKRATFILTLISKKELETYYGLSTLHTFTDSKNNSLVWFKSGYSELELDKVYTLKATVKEHKEYNGKKQTVLTRCKAI